MVIRYNSFIYVFSSFTNNVATKTSFIMHISLQPIMHSVVALAKFMSLPLDISSDSLMFFFLYGSLRIVGVS